MYRLYSYVKQTAQCFLAKYSAMNFSSSLEAALIAGLALVTLDPFHGLGITNKTTAPMVPKANCFVSMKSLSL